MDLLFDGREEAVEIDVEKGEAVGMDGGGHGFEWSYYIRFLFACDASIHLSMCWMTAETTGLMVRC